MQSLLRMTANRALRRVRHLNAVLSAGRGRLRTYCAKTDIVSIGDVSIKIKIPENPHLVPVKYVQPDMQQSVLQHLRWIMQKDVLGQDVFLLGPPGPLRRNIAMMYLELTKREVEYISLSRDTTETDLKQRREIESATAYHIDQCAVRAATKGRVLVLEGIEKAERNVLPVLNNLLENREMQLDDGRFLMAADRYDKLLQDHSQQELDDWKLVRVDEGFRVIALGLPVPRYQGNPLDPPLRSRFQARDISVIPFKEQLDLLYGIGENLPSERVSQLLSFASTLSTSESTSLGLPDFPVDLLPSLIQVLNSVPSIPASDLVQRLYPYNIMLGKEGQTAVRDTLKKFALDHSPSRGIKDRIKDIRLGESGLASVDVVCAGSSHTIQVPCGTGMNSLSPAFIETDFHSEMLMNMLLSHSVKDFCLIGPKGCGKSATVQFFADHLNYDIEHIMLYQDMTSRDLLQQRATLPNGDTCWRPSPLITAATEGKIAVLDGIHRINSGTIAVLHRLIHDRELSLFDGTRLVRHDRYQEMMETLGLSEKELTERSILRVHPSFRMVGLAEPPKVGGSVGQWLNSEMLSMFFYHPMRPLTAEEETQVIDAVVTDAVNIQPLLQLAHKLQNSGDSTLQSIASSLSTRQMLRIARRMASYPNEDLYDAVHRACLSRFLPRLARDALDQALENSEISKPNVQHSIDSIDKAVSCQVKDGVLRIGDTEVPIYNPASKMKVPDILFYDNPQHLSVMEAMLKDFLLGEHLLLVGNQGVGKNKIVDRFLHLLNRPREYIQLHRDTTVQTLTLQPTVRDGVIIYEDSPLVRAVKLGHILVVDEADKAPTHVTCVLKTLLESGEMHLSDGRKIVRGSVANQSGEKNLIKTHPDFRMIVLANRPGFPFLGNDFFAAMGDIYSCHAVDNPSIKSEMSMLKQYGPDVPDNILRKLVLTFGELRNMADQGLISYPYSTREVVNMVKHIQKFPDEGLTSVVRNVFDFDSYNSEIQETIVETLHKHGIPIGAKPGNVDLAKVLDLPAPELVSYWNITGQGDRQKSSLFNCPVEEKKLNIKGPVRMNIQSLPLDRHETRALRFSEQQSHWNVPMHDSNVIADVAVTKPAAHSSTKDDIIHVATANPIALYSMTPKGQHINYIDLYDVFPSTKGSFRPRVKVAPMGASLFNSVVLHEEMTNVILTINTETGDLTRLDTSSLMEAALDRITRNFKSDQRPFKMCRELAHTPEGLLVFYKLNDQSLEVINMLEGTAHSVSLPFKIGSVHLPDVNKWLVTDAETNMKYLLEKTSIMGDRPTYTLGPIKEDALEGKTPFHGRIDLASVEPLPQELLRKALNENVSSPNRVITSRETYAAIVDGFPDLMTSSLYIIPRIPLPDEDKWSWKDPLQKLALKPTAGNVNATVAYLPQSGQVVRGLPMWKVPKEVLPPGAQSRHFSGFLEVTDLVNHKLRYIPVPSYETVSPYTSWLLSASDVNLVLAPMSDDGLVTVDAGGCVRLWETSVASLTRSMQEWRSMMGEDPGKLKVTYDREDSGKEASGPKHGKKDPSNAPHVGGNTWAGGTGGRDTAGLGGVGGPYRLDAGHDVHQVSDEEKERVPEHVRQAARELGQKAFKQRLKEIHMSEYDGDLYEMYSRSVRKQVKSLKVILDSLQAKGKERQWLKNQTEGDLDEAKLIEGLTGEKAIYKRRGEQEPELGSPQQLPKRIKLVVDVSGSMYRFNGHDSRLEREMEAVLMVMEAFEGYENKFQFEIVGHSGEMHDVDFVKQNIPKNNKERLNVLQLMHAHSQFCLSGDNTLEAIKHAVETITRQEADEYFVIALSDANLNRYGIRPQRLGEILMADERVNTFVIFIGSLGYQAHSLTKQLPSGRAFVCLDTKTLPQILQQIFTSTMLSNK